MKKLTLAVATVLAIAGTSCSDSGKNSVLTAARPAGDSVASGCNIRYIDIDSVLSAYTLAQELTAQQQKEMIAFESAARQKQNDLQRRESQIQTKYQNNGYLTQESMETDIKDLQKRQTEANNWMNTHQNRIATLMATQQQRLNDSLQNFLRDYNAVYHYDAILDKKVGFFDPSLDITADIIQGLNERYTPAKEEDKK